MRRIRFMMFLIRKSSKKLKSLLLLLEKLIRVVNVADDLKKIWGWFSSRQDDFDWSEFGFGFV